MGRIHPVLAHPEKAYPCLNLHLTNGGCINVLDETLQSFTQRAVEAEEWVSFITCTWHGAEPNARVLRASSVRVREIVVVVEGDVQAVVNGGVVWS